MLVFGSEMHVVTFVFVVLEFLMLMFLLAGYLNRIQDKQRRLYLLLLTLLLFYNITSGLLPDPKIPIPVYLQNIIAYGGGFLMASYFPYYFYKAFDLKLLRFHAIYGVPMFLLLPYVLFFVISYSINRDLKATIHYGIIIPFFYAFVLLWAIFRAIRVAYKDQRIKKYPWEERLVYAAVIPWGALTVISYFDFGQVVEALFTNIGFVIVTVIFIFKFIQEDRQDINKLHDISVNGIRPEVFDENCVNFGFTARQIEIVSLLRVGYTINEIAIRLHIADRTVTTHLHNMMVKTNTHSRLDLLRKLEFWIFEDKK